MGYDNSAAILAFQIIFICLTSCQNARGHRFSWSYEDMVSNCKPWMSVQVKIENDTNLHNITFTLSTSSVINKRIYVHTSRRNFTARNRVPCLYHGNNINTGDSVFASEIRGRLKMTFKHNGTWYRTVHLMNSSEPAIAEEFQLQDEEPNRCHYKIPPRNFNELNLNDSIRSKVASDPSFGRKKRSLTLQSFQGSAAKKVLELVIVLDRSFVNKAGSEGNAVTRVMQITNYVNGVYQAFSVRIVLTNIIIWTSDAFTITNSPDDTLNSFTVYKAMQVNVKYDTVILLSAVQWNSGATLGLAWMNSLCDRLFASGIVSDKYAESISTAWTLTHEIGHNLGLSHVEDVSGCTCSKTGACIMNSHLSQTYRLQVLDWSTCAVDSWNSQVNATWRSCLADAPEASYYSSRSPMCGNGILETGEQCDCGPAETCSSKCCEATTCRFKSGAVCASGSCCDWNSCTLRLKGDECRSAVGSCDVPETCNGKSEWCPSDDKVADGVECATEQSYCYKGQCKTTDAQCQTVFDSSSSTADSLCYTRLNTRGDVYGHCDMQLESVNYVDTGFKRTYSFASCSASNTECGLLQCYQSTTPSSGSKVTFGSTVCYSQPRIDFSSSGLRSPSFVPNGAKCGTSSMCINSTCTPLSSVKNCPSCPNCNGNGALTTGKVCFCNVGFDPPNCAGIGCGGSITSPLACSSGDPGYTKSAQSREHLKWQLRTLVTTAALLTVTCLLE